MVVQATRFNAGLALGISVHHAAVDGRAFDLFMDAWSSMSRGGASPAVSNKPLSPPNYSRGAIAHPSSDELTHEVLSKVAPNLPLVSIAVNMLLQIIRYELTLTPAAACACTST
jgi:hypothetical protein